MGFTDWLVNLGIKVEAAGTLAGAVPLRWPTGQRGSLVHRLPREPHQRASLFATRQIIIVSEGETAVVLEDGRSLGALGPGRYTIEKPRVTGSLDVVWIAMGQQGLKWGVGNVTSADGIQLSANGVIFVRVTDGQTFNAEVVQGALALAALDLQRLLMPRIQGVLRATLARFPALELQSERRIFVDVVKGALGETLAGLGLVTVDFEVVEIGFPPELKAALAQATLAEHGGKAALVDARTRAQIAEITGDLAEARRLPEAPSPAALPSGEPTAADLERQLDNLVERLSEGKITEDTYAKLAARLEAKLAKLRA